VVCTYFLTNQLVIGERILKIGPYLPKLYQTLSALLFETQCRVSTIMMAEQARSQDLVSRGANICSGGPLGVGPSPPLEVGPLPYP